MLTKAQQNFLLRDTLDGEYGRLIYLTKRGDVTIARALQAQGVGFYIEGKLTQRFKLTELGARVRSSLIERRSRELTGETEEE